MNYFLRIIFIVIVLFPLNIKAQTPAGCLAPTSSVYLEINYVRALIHNGGDMWWDLIGNPSYEVPKGSGKHSSFAGAIWMGGIDVNGQLCFWGNKYRQGGIETWPGPLKSDGSITPDICTYYDRIYKANRYEVLQFTEYINAKKQNNTAELNGRFRDYVIPQSITDWPGNNNIPGYDFFLAPFYDVNKDGVYNYLQGDYPYFDFHNEFNCRATRSQFKPMLYGDETLWWVFNDNGNTHTEFNGQAMKMEIRAQAFGYLMGNELDFMTFYNYYFINRANKTYNDVYVGFWTDADLGDHSDDYVGCDVQRGMGYIYNGDNMDGDGNGKTYGNNPPAWGLDFIRGMYCDANNSDYGFSGVPGGCDESINGQFFNDGIVDNERMGMRHFMYFNNGLGIPSGNPNSAVEAYYYLRSYWRDGTHLTYGGTGFQWPPGTGIPADFMHPGSSDPCGFGIGGVPQPPWDEETANNTPSDRRFVMSSGPFTIEPGGFNELTLGAPWAQSFNTVPGSVSELKRADDIAQRMFDNCFVPITPIEAPDLTVIPLTNELIFHISVPQGSNNYTVNPGDYKKTDPFIGCGDYPCDTTYRFEGFMVFQLKDALCTAADIFDSTKSIRVFQCDISNQIGDLTNYEFDPASARTVRKDYVKNAQNKGMKLTFNLKKDHFATGDNNLVNFKTYYYVAVAYAYNNYKDYNPNIPSQLNGQKRPCMISPVSAFGTPLKIYECIPRNPAPADGGTQLASAYGSGPAIVVDDGLGHGLSRLELSKKTHDKIMAGWPWKADTLEYLPGFGPVKIKIIDPLNVPPARFRLQLLNDSTNYTSNRIKESKWLCEKEPGTSPSDRVYAFQSISVGDEHIIPQWGISIEMKQTEWPGTVNYWPENNGFIHSEITWGNPALAWLDMERTRDAEGRSPMNWIRSGNVYDDENIGFCDYQVPAHIQSIDPNQVYENVIGGTWGPYRLCARDYASSSEPNAPYGVAYHWRHQLINWRIQRLASIDFYFTKDKTKWTRSPVVEMCEYDMSNNTYGTCFSEGEQWKFSLRKHASVDKEGSATHIGNATDEQYSNFIGAEGMGWFPGYCIDIETGERLNIVFGEDSRFPHQNGRDMLWNPTNTFASALYNNTNGLDGDLYVGGKHYIYVFGHNRKPGDIDYMPAYDYGSHIYNVLKNVTVLQDFTKGNIWMNAMWVTLPLLPEDFPVQQNPTDPYYFMRTDCKVSIRIGNPYRKATGDFAMHGSPNDSLPCYNFDLSPFTAVKNDAATAKDILGMINVVPNPYYCGSYYESSVNDFLVKITNLPEICTISIFAVNGTLVKRINKNDNYTWYNWDIRDEKGKPVGSGVYIIHVQIPGIGEKTLKWAGVLRGEY